MRATKESTDDGYVVCWWDGDRKCPLLCFGNYQSAAIEFCDMLNNGLWDKKELQVKMWAKNYDPKVKYSYPELTSTGVKLSRQKNYGKETIPSHQ